MLHTQDFKAAAQLTLPSSCKTDGRAYSVHMYAQCMAFVWCEIVFVKDCNKTAAKKCAKLFGIKSAKTILSWIDEYSYTPGSCFVSELTRRGKTQKQYENAFAKLV